MNQVHEVYVSTRYLQLDKSCLWYNYSNLSNAINEFNKLGLACAFIGILVLFASFNHASSDFWSNTKINWDAIEKPITNGGGPAGYSQETLALIILWVILMMAGSFLLVHIHFRVLREEKR